MSRRKPRLDPAAGCITLLIVAVPLVLLALLKGALESNSIGAVVFILVVCVSGALLARELKKGYGGQGGAERTAPRARLSSKAMALTYLRTLSGHEFERFLADYFRAQGYAVDTTPRTADQGADLLLYKDGRRIAVQAKQWQGNVGNKAVHEAHVGRTFYNTYEAWVISTSSFTKAAQDAARNLGVRLINGEELAQWVSAAESSES